MKRHCGWLVAVAVLARMGGVAQALPVTDGLQLWLDASNMASVKPQGGGAVADGVAVREWHDTLVGGNTVAENATQTANTALQPTWVQSVAGIGGRSAVRFAGTDIMDIEPLTIGGSPTAFFVLENKSQGGGGSIHRSVLAAANDPYKGTGNGYGFGYKRAGSDGVCVSLGDGTTEQKVEYSLAPTNAFEILSYAKDGTLGALLRNGEFMDIGAHDRTSGFYTGKYGLGRQPGSGDRKYNGDIAEVILFDRTLSEAEHNRVGHYLEQKYGLATSFAPPADNVVDIRSAYNADTLAFDPLGDSLNSSGTGYRGGNNEKFLTNLAGDDFPDDGTLRVANGPTFELGPYRTGDNTVRLDKGTATTIDIADQAMRNLSVLHSAVGFNTGYGSQNGELTVNYTDGTSDTYVWDLADNDGNNSQGESKDALTGLTLRKFGPGNGQWGSRQLWYQTLPVNQAKTVDSIGLSVADVTDPDADFGVYSIAMTPSLFDPEPVPLDGQFNRDTIAIAAAEPTGNGYRGNSEVFITEDFAGGPNTPNLPPSGTLVADGMPFQLGPFDDPDTLQNNTWIIPHNQARTGDVRDLRATKLAALFSAVGFGPSNANDGTFTVHYTDGTTQDFQWDVRDSNGAGDNGLATPALSDVDLYDADGAGSFPGNNDRYVFVQSFEVDPWKVVDKVTFSTVGVSDNGDAEFGVYALSRAGFSTAVDLAAKFNRDTIAVANAEPTGGGYRGNSETFIAENFNGGTNAPNIPPDGLLDVGNRVIFEFGPFDSPDTAQNNTWVLGRDDTDSLDVPDQVVSHVSVLFSAVGFNAPEGQQGNNGTVTLHYADGSSDSFEWDLVDSYVHGGWGGLARPAIEMMDLFDSDTDALIAVNNRTLWYQTFLADTAKVLDGIEFSTRGVVDAYGADAEFGIYAVDAFYIPEPCTLTLVGLGLAALASRRRRRR